jgi:hypothetical protein
MFVRQKKAKRDDSFDGQFPFLSCGASGHWCLKADSAEARTGLSYTKGKTLTFITFIGHLLRRVDCPPVR